MTFPQNITTLFAAAEAPAGGAAMQEVIIATLMGGIAFTSVVLIALADRAGKIQWLQKLGEFAGRQAGLPPWAALPLSLLMGSLIIAVTGLYWDISLHLNNGRDEGPLANPSHFLILIGLLGTFSAGVLAATMSKPYEKPSPWAVKLSDSWYAPVGAVLIAVSACFGLIGFPLDDLWHRAFGQDVTLWGPTHLLMLAGAGLTVIGATVLLTEGGFARAQSGDAVDLNKLSTRERVMRKGRMAFGAGGLLVALTIFQGEFDYGIAQFQQLFHPLMVMFAAGLALTYSRIWIGKGGALLAVAFFIVIRGALTLLVTEVFDKPVAHFPTYIGAALAVEFVGLLIASAPKDKPIKFAVFSGIGVGTIGLAAEWAWSNVWMPYPWTENLLPEGAIVGFLAAVSGALIGAWMANSLALRPKIDGAVRWAPLTSLILVMAMIGYGLVQDKPQGLTASMTTTEVAAPDGQSGKWVMVTAKLNTTQFDEGSNWAKSIAWQGPGWELADLENVGPGTWQTTEPLPAFGSWKSMLRFHKGNTLMGVPVFEPRDDAIPAPEVPALANMTRPLQPDRDILQRESKIEGTWLPLLGYAAIFLIAMGLIGSLGWGIWRVSQPVGEFGEAGGSGDTPAPDRQQPTPTATPQAA